MPNVYEYTDYRQFLRDWYAGKKKANPAFSYRVLATKVGYKSPGHFTLILQGKVNVSLELALKFAAYMKLRKAQAQYFQYMVLFNQARKQEEKSEYFRKMASFRQSAVRLLAADQYEYYEKWYHAVVRALLGIMAVSDDTTELAMAVVPAITPQEARRSIELMARLGLLARDGKGNWRPTEALISTGNEATALALNGNVIQNLNRAQEAIDRFGKAERNLSCVTLGISEQGFRSIQQELREFRRRAMQIAEGDEPDRVYQLNLQLFPVSRKRASKGGRSAP